MPLYRENFNGKFSRSIPEPIGRRPEDSEGGAIEETCLLEQQKNLYFYSTEL